MKDSHYFPHDVNARVDEKIIHLIYKMGWEGYGIFWGLIEKLHESGGYMRDDCDIIAFDMRTNSESIRAVLHDYDLFTFQDGRFTSSRVLKNIQIRADISAKARISANKKWDNHRNNANAMRAHSDSNANKSNEIKSNEIKDFKDVVIEKPRPLPPTYANLKKAGML